MIFFSLIILQFCRTTYNEFAFNNSDSLNLKTPISYHEHDEIFRYVRKFRNLTPYMEIEYKTQDNVLKKMKLEFDLFWDDTPKTALNFAILLSRTKNPCYLNNIFHRLIPGFMIQGGDITLHNGTGGTSIFTTNEFEDENFARKHKIGSLCMANRGPNTNSSQFYITFIKTDWLDSHHVVFGQLKEEFISEFLSIQDVLTKKPANSPIKPIKIISCGMSEKTKTVL